MNIVARWSGSVHDCMVFDNTMIRAQFENNEFGNCFLLGDGGYPCRDYLMTPLLNPNTEAGKRYQRAHVGIRNVVERMFGVWKRRFPVLTIGIRTQLNAMFIAVMMTVVATAVFYNILKQQNDEIPEYHENIINNELLNAVYVNPARQTSNLVRTQLINSVFT